MAPDVYLQIAGIFLSFCLKIAAGCMVCLCVTRLLRRPDARFRVWLGFSLATGVYWLVLLGSTFGHWFPRNAAGPGMSALSAAIPDHWLVPIRWSQDVTVAGRALLIAYLCVVLLLACRKLWVHVRLRQLLKLGTSPSADVAALFEDLRRGFGVPRCALTVLPGLSSPATAYWWKPCIVLPQQAASQDGASQLANVFCHELAHIRRNDYLWANVADVVCGILFFHPAVWQARKQMRLERELACDLAVVNARPDVRADYADDLARFVRLRMLQGGVSCGVDFAASASMLGARIRNILAEPVHVPWWKKLSAAATSVALLLSFLLLSPDLSVGLAFSSNSLSRETQKPLAAQPRPVAKSATRRSHITAAPLRAAQPQEAAEPAFEDTLRHARTRSYMNETPAYRLTSGSPNPDVNVSSNWDSPAMSEPSPASPPTGKPSMTKIVLTTVGGVVIKERSEHGGHGHER